jgi:hypothetical protein
MRSRRSRRKGMLPWCRVDGMKAEYSRCVNDRGPHSTVIPSAARDLLRGHRTWVRRSLAALAMTAPA